MKIKKTQNSKHVRVDTERWLWHIKRILTCAYECFIHWSVLALSLTHHGVVPKMNEYCQEKNAVGTNKRWKGQKRNPNTWHSFSCQSSFYSFTRWHNSFTSILPFILSDSFSEQGIFVVTPSITHILCVHSFIRSVGSLNRTHTHTHSLFPLITPFYRHGHYLWALMCWFISN